MFKACMEFGMSRLSGMFCLFMYNRAERKPVKPVMTIPSQQQTIPTFPSLFMSQYFCPYSTFFLLFEFKKVSQDFRLNSCLLRVPILLFLFVPRLLFDLAYFCHFSLAAHVSMLLSKVLSFTCHFLYASHYSTWYQLHSWCPNTFVPSLIFSF